MRVTLILVVFLLVSQKPMAQDSLPVSKLFFISTPITRISIDSFYSYRYQAMDSAGNPLSYSIINQPGWLDVDPSSQIISGKPPKLGQYALHIQASTGNQSLQQDFVLTVFNKETANVLCLGNSITNGTDKYNSYRRPLWQLLKAAHCNFDFIGSWDKHHMGGPVPNPDFDMDHDGHSGWTTNHLFIPPEWDSARGNINRWLLYYVPDIVLVELGTNDVFQCRTVNDVIKDLTHLVAVLRGKNKNVKIFIAQVPPLGARWAPKKLCLVNRTYGDVLKELNRRIPGLTARLATKQSPIQFVDQYTGVNPTKDMYDDIHPNDKGEAIMAKRWYKAILPYLKKLD